MIADLLHHILSLQMGHFIFLQTEWSSFVQINKLLFSVMSFNIILEKHRDVVL